MRDVACECNDPYASVTTIQAFFDLGGTAEGTAEMLLEGIHGQHCTVPNIQDLWKEYCAGGVPALAETTDADAEELVHAQAAFTTGGGGRIAAIYTSSYFFDISRLLRL